MHTDRFSDITAGLRTLGGQRVWSLMVSLFGDLLLDQRHSIDGPMLSQIMDGLHIKPEATRVALHRLRNDGWITSKKQGRISLHSLSDQGRRESLAASPRIYAAPDTEGVSWQLVLTKKDEDVPAFTQLMPRIWVGSTAAHVPPDAICFPGEFAPDWLRKELEPDALRQGYADLRDTLSVLAAEVPEPETLPALQRAILRCLIVHNWRRLILKQPTLPTSLTTSDWPGLACHRLVFDLLERLPRPDINRS